MKMSNSMVQRCNMHKQAFQRAQPSCATKRSNVRPSVPTCDQAFQRAQQILSPTCYKCVQAARLVARLYPQGSCAAVQLPLSSRKRASPRTRQRCLCKVQPVRQTEAWGNACRARRPARAARHLHWPRMLLNHIYSHLPVCVGSAAAAASFFG